MLRGAIVRADRQAELMARSTAPLFITGSVPGSARSTGAGLRVGLGAERGGRAAEDLAIAVDSWAWVSKPMTTS